MNSGAKGLYLLLWWMSIYFSSKFISISLYENNHDVKNPIIIQSK